jgi:hypothetical protein
VLNVLAGPQPRCSRLARAFRKIHYSVCQILLPTCVSWTCTCLCKFVCPWAPRWPRYRGHSNCYRCCPADSSATHFAVTFPGHPMLKTSCSFATTYSILSITAPQNVSPIGYTNTMPLMIKTLAIRRHTRLVCTSRYNGMPRWSNMCLHALADHDVSSYILNIYPAALTHISKE